MYTRAHTYMYIFVLEYIYTVLKTTVYCSYVSPMPSRLQVKHPRSWNCL